MRAVGVVAMAACMLTVGGCAAMVDEPGAAPSATSSSPHGGSRNVKAAGASGTGTATGSPTGTGSAGAESSTMLPLGGRVIFPAYRLVGWAGAPHSSSLGRLGTGPLDQTSAAMVEAVRPYGQGRTVLPVLELITVVVQASAGRDGRYRFRQPDSVVQEWLDAARAHKGLLLLNIQPGRSDFLTEVKAYDRWLREPDVGVALDPEWAMGPGQVPGRAYGHTTGAEIDAVSAHLADIVRKGGLPQKALVYHQVAPQVVTGLGGLQERPEVAVVRSVDGIGNRAEKTTTWKRINKVKSPAVHPGFKLFFDEDRKAGPLMTPAQVLALTPEPDYVLYE